MRKRLLTTAPVTLGLVIATCAQAQDEDPAQSPAIDIEQTLDVVIVKGTRRRGVVPGGFTPEFEFSAEEIDSYGAWDLDELLEILGPVLGSGASGGRPVVLVNGEPVAGFRALRRYPPEAIERMDVLPPEAAVQFGYAPDRRVVNFVLRDRFAQLRVTQEGRAPTDGGQFTSRTQGQRLNIRGMSRFNIDLDYNRANALLESERDIEARSNSLADQTGNVTALTPDGEIDPALSALAGDVVTIAGAPLSAVTGLPALTAFSAGRANETDVAEYRSLRPRTESVELTASVTGKIFDDISATLTGGIDASRSESLLGLSTASLILPAASPFSPFTNDVRVERAFGELGALRQESESWSASLESALRGRGTDWNWSLTGRYQHSESTNDTDRGVDRLALSQAVSAGAQNPFGFVADANLLAPVETVERVSDNATLRGNVSIRPVDLPAGKLNLSLSGNASLTRQETTSNAPTGPARRESSERNASLQASVSAPLMRKGETAAPLGDVTLDANMRWSFRTGAEAVPAYGYGIDWKPDEKLLIRYSWDFSEIAAGIEESDALVIRTPNSRVFDFTTGETLDDVTIITGGAVGLVNATSTRREVSVQYTPLKDRWLRLEAAYKEKRDENQISSFPALTPSVEAAFPDRFIRNAQGRLIEIDSRPVNFGDGKERSLRFGININKRLGPSGRPGRPAGAGRGPRPQGGPAQRSMPPRSGGVPGRPDRQGRPAAQPAGEKPAPSPQSATPSRDAGAPVAPNAARGAPGRRPGARGRARPQRPPFIGFSVYHDYVLENSLTLGASGERLDLLGGDAIGFGNAGARHRVNAQFRFNRNKLGGRAAFNWQSGYDIISDNGALAFSELGKLDLTLNWRPGRTRGRDQEKRLLDRVRVRLFVDNALNARQQVTDENGETPLNFQPALRDPLGRVVGFSIGAGL